MVRDPETASRTTLAAIILDYAGLYCEDSWSPGWGHLYVRTTHVYRHPVLTLAQITVIVSVSVSVAMYCLLQLYMPISGYLQPQKPLLKLFAVKAVGKHSCRHLRHLG